MKNILILFMLLITCYGGLRGQTAKQYNESGLSKAKLGDDRGAIQDFNKAIELEPYNVNAYNYRGLLKAKLGEYRGAIQDFNKAIEINPKDAFAYSYRGISKAGLEDHKGAIQDYNKSIELVPNDAIVYYYRGLERAKLEDYQGAIQDYNEAIALNPKDATSYFNRGRSKANLHDYIGAIQDYTKVLESDPRNTEAYYFRGWSKSMLNDNRGAIVDFDKAIENSQIRTGSIYTGRGWSKYNLGTSYAKTITKNNAPSQNGIQFNESDLMAAQIDENSRANAWGGTASTTYDKALERQRQAAVEREKNNSQNQQINAQDAEASAQSMKYYRGAIIDFTTAIEINEKDVSAYIGRVFTKLKLGDTNGACTDWSKAGELGDTSVYELIRKYCQ